MHHFRTTTRARHLRHTQARRLALARLAVRLRDSRRVPDDQERYNRRRPRRRGCCKGEHRLALWGTPVENHLGELWSLFDFLNPGCSAAASFSADHGWHTPTRRGRGSSPRRCGRSSCAAPRSRSQRNCRIDSSRRSSASSRAAAAQAVRRAARPLPRSAARRASTTSGESVEDSGTRRYCGCDRPRAIRRCSTDRADRRPQAKLDAADAASHANNEEGHKALVFSQFTSFLALAPRSSTRAASTTNTSTARPATARHASSSSRTIRLAGCSSSASRPAAWA